MLELHSLLWRIIVPRFLVFALRSLETDSALPIWDIVVVGSAKNEYSFYCLNQRYDPSTVSDNIR